MQIALASPTAASFVSGLALHSRRMARLGQSPSELLEEGVAARGGAPRATDPATPEASR